MSRARIQKSRSHCELLRAVWKKVKDSKVCSDAETQTDRRSLCLGLETLGVVTPRPSGTA